MLQTHTRSEYPLGARRCAAGARPQGAQRRPALRVALPLCAYAPLRAVAREAPCDRVAPVLRGALANFPHFVFAGFPSPPDPRVLPP